MLLEETERLATLSENSIDAVHSLRSEIERTMNDAEPQNKIVRLIDGLKVLSKEHDEVRGMMMPIIEALQFQDRMKQNLENLKKEREIITDETLELLYSTPVSGFFYITDSELKQLGVREEWFRSAVDPSRLEHIFACDIDDDFAAW